MHLDVQLSFLDIGLKVRLADGNFSNEGRVEVYYQGKWGAICNQYWDAYDATVVCKMLGYSFGVPLRYTLENGRWLDNRGYKRERAVLGDVHCLGAESTLQECFSSTGFRLNHYCKNRYRGVDTDDAGVMCTEDKTMAATSMSNL